MKLEYEETMTNSYGRDSVLIEIQRRKERLLNLTVLQVYSECSSMKCIREIASPEERCASIHCHSISSFRSVDKERMFDFV